MGLARSIYGALKHDDDFLALLVSLVICLSGGTVFYTLAEGWPWLDALYFCVMTVATIGSDLSPATPVAKVFTMVYLFTGVGLFYGVVFKILVQIVQRNSIANAIKGVHK
ncbi:potassium channel protein [Simiduia agarivorans SA1 = DSM 21679]|uniref:Potassium channel protein n=1 Tax=Simiduia agarivorans (strain DSM 21679 / JCM 13881 / BCRC 17597 / SA1) TaxID=1117647 RepID=K4KK17_SIMAS|nr:potassium channel protein [Simiduia agarivorans SA1 = DSM 21679]